MNCFKYIDIFIPVDFQLGLKIGCMGLLATKHILVRPKLKNTLFALYRPYFFGLGRSVGKMFYFFQAISPIKR